MAVPGEVAEKKTGRSTYTRTRARSRSQGQKDLPRDFAVNVAPFLLPVGALAGVGRLLAVKGFAAASAKYGKDIARVAQKYFSPTQLRMLKTGKGRGTPGNVKEMEKAYVKFSKPTGTKGKSGLENMSMQKVTQKEGEKLLGKGNARTGTLKSLTKFSATLGTQEGISMGLDKALPKSAPGEKVGTDKSKAGSEVGPKAASEAKGKATVTPTQKSRQATIDKPVPKPKPKPNRSTSSQDEMGGGSSAPKPKPRPKVSKKEEMGDMKTPAKKAGSELGKEAGAKGTGEPVAKPRSEKPKKKAGDELSKEAKSKSAMEQGKRTFDTKFGRITVDTTDEGMDTDRANFKHGGMAKVKAFGKGGMYKAPKKTYGMRKGGFTRRGASR